MFATIKQIKTIIMGDYYIRQSEKKYDQFILALDEYMKDHHPQQETAEPEEIMEETVLEEELTKETAQDIIKEAVTVKFTEIKEPETPKNPVVDIEEKKEELPKENTKKEEAVKKEAVKSASKKEPVKKTTAKTTAKKKPVTSTKKKTLVDVATDELKSSILDNTNNSGGDNTTLKSVSPSMTPEQVKQHTKHATSYRMQFGDIKDDSGIFDNTMSHAFNPEYWKKQAENLQPESDGSVTGFKIDPSMINK